MIIKKIKRSTSERICKYCDLKYCIPICSKYDTIRQCILDFILNNTKHTSTQKSTDLSDTKSSERSNNIS